MKTTVNEKAESIKDAIKGTAQKSKETIREIIDSNSKYVVAALDSNEKIVESIKETLSQQKIKDSITGSVQSTFGKSIVLAEDAIDSIINSYTRQMELNVDLNTKLLDVFKESNSQSPEKVLNLIHENFEASHQLTVNNTKEILSFYNKHTNLALNFNEKFGKNIVSQIESLGKVRNKGMEMTTEWATEWYK